MKHVQQCWIRMWCGVVGVVFLLFASTGCKPKETIAGDMCVLPEPPDPPKENVAGGGPTPRNQENCEQLPAGVPEMPVNEQQTPVPPMPGEPEATAPKQAPPRELLIGGLGVEPQPASEQIPPEEELMGDIEVADPDWEEIEYPEYW